MLSLLISHNSQVLKSNSTKQVRLVTHHMIHMNFLNKLHFRSNLFNQVLKEIKFDNLQLNDHLTWLDYLNQDLEIYSIHKNMKLTRVNKNYKRLFRKILSHLLLHNMSNLENHTLLLKQ